MILLFSFDVCTAELNDRIECNKKLVVVATNNDNRNTYQISHVTSRYRGYIQFNGIIAKIQQRQSKLTLLSIEYVLLCANKCIRYALRLDW